MKRISKKTPLCQLELAALQEAVDKLIDERCVTNQPLIIWRNGKVASVPARTLKRERTARSKIAG